MTYQLNINNGKEKSVIDFLKTLDFVTITVIKETEKPTKKNKMKFSYFDACSDWDFDVKQHRASIANKRLKEWL